MCGAIIILLVFRGQIMPMKGTICLIITNIIWVFPNIGVPQNGWFIMENPIKMGWFGGFSNLYFWFNTHLTFYFLTTSLPARRLEISKIDDKCRQRLLGMLEALPWAPCVRRLTSRDGLSCILDSTCQTFCMKASEQAVAVFPRPFAFIYLWQSVCKNHQKMTKQHTLRFDLINSIRVVFQRFKDSLDLDSVTDQKTSNVPSSNCLHLRSQQFSWVRGPQKKISVCDPYVCVYIYIHIIQSCIFIYSGIWVSIFKRIFFFVLSKLDVTWINL